MIKADVFSVGTNSTDSHLTRMLNDALVHVQEHGGKVVRVETAAAHGMFLFTVLYDDMGHNISEREDA